MEEKQMAKSTATGANENQERKITFKNKEHEKFYNTYLSKCRYQDAYHKSLVYCLGLSEDTRRNVNRIYDFKTGFIKPECLQEGWQTSGSEKIVRIAFNLYTDGTPTTDEYDDTEEGLTDGTKEALRILSSLLAPLDDLLPIKRYSTEDERGIEIASFIRIGNRIE